MLPVVMFVQMENIDWGMLFITLVETAFLAVVVVTGAAFWST